MCTDGQWVAFAAMRLMHREVLKIFDNSLLDVEQVIEVPKIILHTVRQRSSLLEPQMAEQLVEVPVLDTVALAVGVDAAGAEWCQVAAREEGL